MNITQLQYFVATVRARSYSEAAHELFISPQAISKAIGDLERELGVSLLARGRKEVVLTSFGELFFEKANELVFDFADLSTLAQSHQEGSADSGVLNIAVASSPYQGELINHEAFEAFRNTYPDISLTLVLKSSGSCLSAFLAEIVDAAIILGRTKNPEQPCIRLYSLAPSVILSKNHPLAHKEAVSFEDLRDMKVARPDDLHFSHQEIERQFKKRRCNFSYVDIPPFVEEYQRFFDEEHGVMFTTGDQRLQELYSNIVIRPLNEHDLFLIPVCLVRPETRKNEALTSFETYLTKVFADRQFTSEGIYQREITKPEPNNSSQ